MNRFNRQVGDWIKLHTGHTVMDRDDPRRVGRVEAIRHGFFAVVKWADTGWTTKVPIDRLELCGDAPTKNPRTFQRFARGLSGHSPHEQN